MIKGPNEFKHLLDILTVIEQLFVGFCLGLFGSDGREVNRMVQFL